MTHIIPEDAQRLADRLRSLADEIESAARYGVPIPFMVNVNGHTHGGASFSATEHQFAAWAEYAEAAVEEDDYEGCRWSRAKADLNGLPLEFAHRHTAHMTVGGQEYVTAVGAR